MSAHVRSAVSRRPGIPFPSFRGVLARVRRADERYRQRVTLRDLDARLLEDIGVTEADLVEEMRRSVWS